MRLQIKDGNHVGRSYILDVVSFSIYVLHFKSIVFSVRNVPGQSDPRIIYFDRLDRSDRFRI